MTCDCLSAIFRTRPKRPKQKVSLVPVAALVQAQQVSQQGQADAASLPPSLLRLALSKSQVCINLHLDWPLLTKLLSDDRTPSWKFVDVIGDKMLRVDIPQKTQSEEEKLEKLETIQQTIASTAHRAARAAAQWLSFQVANNVSTQRFRASNESCTSLLIDLRLNVFEFLLRVMNSPEYDPKCSVIGRFVDDDRKRYYLLYPFICVNQKRYNFSVTDFRWRFVLSRVRGLDVELRDLSLMPNLVRSITRQTARHLIWIKISIPPKHQSAMLTKDDVLFDPYFNSLVQHTRFGDWLGLNAYDEISFSNMLESLPNLKSIRHEFHGEFDAIEKHPSIQCFKGNASERDIARLATIPKLKSLSLRLADQASVRPFQECFAVASHLTKLTLRSRGFSGNRLSNIVVCPQLRELKIKLLALHSLEGLEQMPHLRVFHLDNDFSNAKPLLHWEVLLQCKSLLDLSLRGIRIEAPRTRVGLRLKSQVVVPILAKLVQNHSLEHLNVCFTEDILDHADLEAILGVDEHSRHAQSSIRLSTLTVDGIGIKDANVAFRSWSPENFFQFLVRLPPSVCRLILTTERMYDFCSPLRFELDEETKQVFTDQLQTLEELHVCIR